MHRSYTYHHMGSTTKRSILIDFEIPARGGEDTIGLLFLEQEDSDGEILGQKAMFGNWYSSLAILGDAGTTKFLSILLLLVNNT